MYLNIVEQIKQNLVSKEELFEYITDNDLEIAVAAASSHLADEIILDVAAHDKDREVRLAAVKNPNIGKSSLLFLSNDIDNDISLLAKKILEGK